MIIPGFPTEVSEYIELPPLEELLLMPNFVKVTPEEFRKYGTETQRMLLDKTPLRHNTKYITIYSYSQFLYPEVGANATKFKGEWMNEWHWDSGEDVSWHILTNDCEARTAFNVNPIEIANEKFNDILKLSYDINKNPEQFGVIGKKMEPNKILTFGKDHLHTATSPTKPEFRYFLRIQETNYLKPYKYEEQNFVSMVFSNTGEIMSSIRQTHGGLKVLHESMDRPYGGLWE